MKKNLRNFVWDPPIWGQRGLLVSGHAGRGREEEKGIVGGFYY